MTEEQERQITDLRNAGLGYTAIAKRLDLTRIEVRAFSKAHGLMGRVLQESEEQTTVQDGCKTCGKKLKHTTGKKKKQFCSDQCRMDWWNAHPNKVKRTAFYTFTCAFCGDEFTSYGNANRKYCCHECYIYDRYSKDNV